MPRFAALTNRFAAIDIGTNSIKMTAAEVAGSQVDILTDSSEITRLGRGVDASRRLSEVSVEKTLIVLRRFVAEAGRLGAAQICACGTSVLRDAENGADFRARAKAILGSDIEIVGGEREAELTFLGAMSDPAIGGRGTRVLAFDVGGGSTELIVGIGGRIARSQSIDIGAVRITERLLHGDPPSPNELAAAQNAIDASLSSFEAGPIDRIVGIGGTATTVAAMLSRPESDLQGMEVADARIARLLDRLASMPVETRRGTPGLDPARADVIVAGMLLIRRILSCFGRPSYLLSTRGVRYGLLLQMSGQTRGAARIS